MFDGEQKALLLGIVLAHADLVTEQRGLPLCYCWTRWRRISIRRAGRRCSSGWRGGGRCG